MTDPKFTQHLTEEHFSNLLAGELPDSLAEAHLAECSLCRDEIVAVRHSLASFNEVGMAWAQAEAVHRVAVPSRLARLSGRPGWSVSLAATAAGLMVALGLGLPSGGRSSSATQPSVIAVVPSTDEVAQDNRLMRNIDQELRYNVQPVVPAAELQVIDQVDKGQSADLVAN